MTNDLTRERWKTRRLMAWLSLFGLFVMPILIMLKSAEWLVSATSIIIAIIGFLSSIIMVYIGASTVDDVMKK